MDIFSIIKSALEQTIEDCNDLIKITNEPSNPISVNPQQARVLKAACNNAKDRLCHLKSKQIDNAVDLTDKQSFVDAYNGQLDALQTIINQF